MNLRKSFSLFTTILVLLSISLQGVQPAFANSARPQSDDGIEIGYHSETGKVSYVGASSSSPTNTPDSYSQNLSPEERGLALLSPYAEQFGLKDISNELINQGSVQENDREVTRYQQVYQGIPVLAGELVVNSNARGLLSINGEIAPDLKLDTMPQISADDARQSASEMMAKWYQAAPGDFSASAPELWIYDSRLLEPDGNPARLVWRMEFSANDLSMPVRELVLVDAVRGNIVLHFNQVDTAWNMGFVPDEEVPPIDVPDMEAAPEIEIADQPSSDVEQNDSPPAEFAPSASGQTWYVSTTGDDAHDCASPVTACKSIQHAINISNKLDSIKVMQGTYKISDNQICEGTLCRAISLTDKNVEILGGWDSKFAQQVGFSIIDSEMSGYGVMVSPASTLIMEKIIVTNGYTVYGSTAGIWNLGTLTVRESVIHNNTISGFASGGAAILSLGTLFITNSTIVNNKNADVPQSTYASAVSVLAGTAIIKNSTISHNKAIGIMNGGSGNVSIQNSIVAGNYVSASNETPYDCSGILISNGYNLIQNKTCNITANTGDIFNINPYLGAYSVEQSLVPLLQNSPAIDAGNPAVPGSGGYACEEIDQFGTSRPIDGNQDALSVCDMGAYETTPPIVSVVTNISVVAGSNQTAVINTPYLPFSVLITDQYGVPLDGVSVEFVGPASGPGGKFSTTGTNKVNVTTNSSGLATSPELVANDIGGQYVVEASVSGLSSVVKFSLENYRPVPTSISVYSGDNQNVSPGRIFKHNLKVIVRDNFGRPLGGALVKFSAPDSGPSGIFSDTNNNTTMAITDDAGVAIAAPMSANLINGTFNVLASVADLPQTAQFNLNNIQLYVHPSGSDTSTCTTPNAPCKTISGALSKGISEITIFVADGVYRNSGNSGFVLNISDNIFLSGGWDDSFTIQNGFSTIDGENSKAGVVVNSSAVVYIERFIVQHSGNDEKQVGGIGNSGVLTLNQCTISNNNTYYRGGGIQNYGTLTLINSTVSHNHSNMHGGGIYNSLQATLSVTDSEIANNTSKYQDSFSGGVETYGGGLYNKGKVFIDRGRFYNNSAFYGGGIYNDTSGDLAIQNSSIFNNQVDAGGGGLANASEKANLESITFSNNLATSGGGIFTYKAIKLNNVTIANNFARYKGGGIFSDQYENGVFNLTNTIIADNVADDYVSDCYGQAASGGYNIIGSTVGCSVISKTGDKFDVTPKLGIFLPGEGYSVLLKNSPAIDAGDHSNCKATDQRGVIRVDGNSDSIVTCDIGAIEYVFPTGVPGKLTVVSGNNQHASPDAEFQIPLKAVVLDTAGHPMGGVAVTFSSPATGPGGFFTNNLNTITRISDVNGVADAGIFMANHQRGSYFVTASAVGISENISFNLENIVWFVSPNGSFAHDCRSPETTCPNIQSVLSKASFYPNDTIWMSIGTYYSADMVVISKDAIIVGGWNAEYSQLVGTSVNEHSFRIDPFVKADLRRVTIQNATLGLYNQSGEIIFRDGAIKNLSGSAIFNQAGRSTIINSTISGNSGFDAAIYNSGGDSKNTVLILSSTITQNKSIDGALRNAHGAGQFIIANSIIAGNTNSYGSPPRSPDCSGEFISLGHNLIGNIGRIDLAECKVNFLGSDQYGYYVYDALGYPKENLTLDPTIDPLQDIGNSVWVHPLKFGSPAIDAGSPVTSGTSGNNVCPATDQRGVTRPQGLHCDIGAYEFEPYQSSPVRISTYDANHGKALPGVLLCQNDNSICASGVTGANTAHSFAYGTYAFYLDRHGRSSIDNNGLELVSTLRYGSNYNNAFWTGQQMVYGDAKGFANADDVVAHELTHGVTDYESGLFYFYQSGAINESLSDLWGEAYDQIGNPTGSDTVAVKWLIGEDITGQGAFRNMKNPPQFGHPDKMTSPAYHKNLEDNGGVHINSGVNNKAVSLMVDGGTFNGQTVSALGWDKVLVIYYEAQANLLTSGADYLDLHNIIYQACRNKVGTSGITDADCNEVRKATLAVEMHLSPVAGFNPNTALCPDGMPLTSVIYHDDFETGNDGWVFAASDQNLQTAWQLYAGNATSGIHNLWGDDGYTSTLSYAQTTIKLANGAPTYLHFSHSYLFEFGPNGYYDGGLLEYSLNGHNWYDASALFNAGKNYTGAIYNPGAVAGANPLRGRQAFVGSSNGYVQSRYNLSAYTGNTIYLRWSLGTDYIGSGYGWWLDDIKVVTCGTSPTIFNDVPGSHWAWNHIERLYSAGITGGCATSPLAYCPESIVTRAQMAVFLLKGTRGSSYSPPAATGARFTDVPSAHWAAAWIEQLAEDGITGGCGDGNYCPESAVTRAQMAVFLLKSKYGANYKPPTLDDSGSGFTDVPAGHWAAPWIKQLAAEGITGGCGAGVYCPEAAVTRAQMAVFLVKAFNLP